MILGVQPYMAAVVVASPRVKVVDKVISSDEVTDSVSDLQ